MRGTDYEFSLPDGWTPSSEAGGPAAPGGALDVQIVRDGNRGIQPTINVIAAEPRRSLQDLAAETLGGIRADPAVMGLPAGTRTGRPSSLGSLQIDGERALRYSVIADFEGQRLRLQQIVVSRGDSAYVISLTTDRGGAAAGEEGLDQALATWTWDFDPK